VTPTGGSTSRSATAVANLPQFRLEWRDAVRVSPEVITGRSGAEAAPAVAAKPMLLFLYDGDTEGARDGVESPVFLNDRIVILARFFDLIRIDLESARLDRALAEVAGGKQSRLVMLRPNYEVASVMTGRLDVNRVAPAMVKTLRADFANSPEAVFKEQAALGKERMALEERASKIAKLREQQDAEKSADRRAKLHGEIEELVRAVDEADQKLLAREQALYVLKPKAG